MSSSPRLRVLAWGAIALLLSVASTAFAEEGGERKQPEADLAVEEVIGAQPKESLQDQVNTANNPLADLIAFSLHNYYFPRLNGVPGESANTFWLASAPSTPRRPPATPRLVTESTRSG